MKEWSVTLSQIASFKSEEIENAFKQFLEQKGMGIGAVLPLFRLLVTGKGMGPSMFSIAELLGKEECINRMNTGIEKLS
jgi:glutamyl-tRNA synthetase